MATKFLHEARSGASKGSIDFPLALLAGLSLGFVAFVMPGDLLSRAVELSQLPAIVPAAEPPLGNKARAAVAVVAASATILAVFLLLRTLGRKAAAPQRHREREAAEPEREFEAPRLRRSDVHPDAPARRPILAARELGEPAPSRTPSSASFWRPDDFPPEPQDEGVEDAAEDELELGAADIEMIAPAPAPAEPPAQSLSKPLSEPVAAASTLPETPAFIPPRPEPVFAAALRAEPTARPPVADEPAADASIAELMARLERGLARRRQERPEAIFAPPPETPEPAVFSEPDRGDDRLRSAIENLQKMAARGR